jgi:8-oxo-dGTP pyrophosphatase MutT (NUDIX family)
MREYNRFPRPFHCYRLWKDKVYGTICLSSKGKYALVKGVKSGKWSFPKGHRHTNERYVECAKRETYEETGLDLKYETHVDCRRLSVGEYYFFELKNELELYVNDTREVSEAGWFTLDEMKYMTCNVDVNYFLRHIR